MEIHIPTIFERGMMVGFACALLGFGAVYLLNRMLEKPQEVRPLEVLHGGTEMKLTINGRDWFGYSTTFTGVAGGHGADNRLEVLILYGAPVDD